MKMKMKTFMTGWTCVYGWKGKEKEGKERHDIMCMDYEYRIPTTLEME